MKLTMCRSGISCRSLRWRPRCQTVSYAAVRSSRTTPAFSPTWKVSSMSWVRRVTWSVVDFPRRKPACSLGSCGSMTGSRRAYSRRSITLYGTHKRDMGRYPLGSSRGLLGFGRAITLARRHIFGSFDQWRHTEQKTRSHSSSFGPWCRMNSGWMLSGPGDFPDLSLRIADVISTSVKSLERSESADGALHRSRTLDVVCLEKILSASGNRPLFVSCEAMASAVIGQIDGLLVRPVNLFRVCHARLLEWVKSIDATVSAHLSLRFSSNLRCRFVAAVSLSSSDCVSLWV